MSSFEPTKNNAWEIPTVKKPVLSPSGVGFRGVSIITNPLSGGLAPYIGQCCLQIRYLKNLLNKGAPSNHDGYVYP